MKKNKIPRQHFTSKQIENHFGLKINTLHYYVQAGIITPEIDRGSGTGHQRLFSETNAVEAAIIAKLMKMGLAKKNIAKVFEGIAKAGERKRLDPRNIVDSDDSVDFLLIYPGDDGNLSHRFVSNMGPEFSKKGKAAREIWRVTSVDQPENIYDFMFSANPIISINLSLFMSLALFSFLCLNPELLPE